MARKIVVTSGKGGVGKTTVSANLSIALASLGQKVCVVDVDFGLNNLDVVMGVEGRVVYDILDVLEGRCRIKQALIQDKYKKNLFILTSGNIDSFTKINGQTIKLLIENISPLFDYIIFDCPAGVDNGFHRAVACADEAIIVTTSQLTSLRDADKVISILNSYKLQNIYLVVNKVRGDLIILEKMFSPLDIQELLKIKLLGVLPDDDSVFLYSGYELPKKTGSYKAYKILANNLHKGNKKIYDVYSKYTGFFGSIRRGIRRSLWEKIKVNLLGFKI